MSHHKCIQLVRRPRNLLRTLVCAGALLHAGGAEASRYLNVEQRAMAACMIAFVARIMPAAQDRVRYVMPAESSVFAGRHTYDRATMTLRARAASSGGDLASGICTVGRDGRVVQLDVTVQDATRLAALSPGELQWVVSTP